MADREKVIKGLEMCLADEYCNGCPYEEECFDPDIDNPWGSGVMRDALAILKEQEAKEQISDAIHETAKQFRQTIVRCRDCRHCTFSDGEQLADCMIKQGWFPVKPDWFCADGERRTEDA